MKAALAISSPWFSMTRVAAKAAPTNNGLLEEAFAPNVRLRWRKGCDEGCSGNLEPMVLGDAEVAAEAAPTAKWGRGGSRSYG
jgi:hypothetical protein